MYSLKKAIIQQEERAPRINAITHVHVCTRSMYYYEYVLCTMYYVGTRYPQESTVKKSHQSRMKNVIRYWEMMIGLLDSDPECS